MRANLSQCDIGQNVIYLIDDFSCVFRREVNQWMGPSIANEKWSQRIRVFYCISLCSNQVFGHVVMLRRRIPLNQQQSITAAWASIGIPAKIECHSQLVIAQLKNALDERETEVIAVARVVWRNVVEMILRNHPSARYLQWVKSHHVLANNVDDHPAARDWVTIENEAPFAAGVHRLVMRFMIQVRVQAVRPTRRICLRVAERSSPRRFESA